MHGRARAEYARTPADDMMMVVVLLSAALCSPTAAAEVDTALMRRELEEHAKGRCC